MEASPLLRGRVRLAALVWISFVIGLGSCVASYLIVEPHQAKYRQFWEVLPLIAKVYSRGIEVAFAVPVGLFLASQYLLYAKHQPREIAGFLVVFSLIFSGLWLVGARLALICLE